MPCPGSFVSYYGAYVGHVYEQIPFLWYCPICKGGSAHRKKLVNPYKT